MHQTTTDEGQKSQKIFHIGVRNASVNPHAMMVLLRDGQFAYFTMPGLDFFMIFIIMIRISFSKGKVMIVRFDFV